MGQGRRQTTDTGQEHTQAWIQSTNRGQAVYQGLKWARATDRGEEHTGIHSQRAAEYLGETPTKTVSHTRLYHAQQN